MNLLLIDPQVTFLNKIQYNYDAFITEEDTEYMNSIYDRLFNVPLGPDFADYFVLNLSRGWVGDLVKRICFCLGDTNTLNLLL